MNKLTPVKGVGEQEYDQEAASTGQPFAFFEISICGIRALASLGPEPLFLLHF